MNRFTWFYKKLHLLAFLSVVLFLANGCKSNARMKETFEGEPQNVPPPEFPAPNPPADDLIWSKQFMLPKVVSRPDGGQWVMIGAKEAFNNRVSAGILTASSDAFQSGMNGNPRGSLTLRLDGPGIVNVTLFAVGSERKTSPLGGYSVRNGVGSADVASLNSQDVAVWQNNPFLKGGTFLANYSPGKVIEFSWSLDQTNLILHLNVSPGGSAQPINVPKISANGVNSFPLQRIMLLIDGYEWSANTILFIDDVKIDEL